MDSQELLERLATFAREVAEYSRPLVASLDTRDPALQLKRAAASAAANHRAARKARSRREFVAKLGIAQEEADEAAFWLEHLAAIGAPKSELLHEAHQLTAILTRSFTTARDRLGR